MEDFIVNLASEQGWTDATTKTVLTGVMQDLVDAGAVRDQDLRDMVLARANLPEEIEAPEEGDVVEMIGVDAQIVVKSIDPDGRKGDDGVWTIVDQYGERHEIERESNDDVWTVAVPAI